MNTQNNKIQEIVNSCISTQHCVLVATYKKTPNQLDWINYRHLYNYPLSEEEAKSPIDGWSKIKELWLYSGSKTQRYIYDADFAGIMPSQNFHKANPDYPKNEGNKTHGDYYAVFNVKYKYHSTINNPQVIVRIGDFSKRTSKIAQAIKAFQKSNNIESLLDYLPTDLSKLQHNQLCVCEVAQQLQLFNITFPSPASPHTITAHKELNVISLFSGAMGLDNGIEKAGLNIRLCVEIQHAMAETIRANKPELKLIEDDVRNYSGSELKKIAGLDKNEEVFLVCGGPPCQAFSTAGKRLGFDDERGNVFLKYIDLIDEIRPKYYLLENVRGLLSASYSPPLLGNEEANAINMFKGSALLYALERLRNIGYSATFTLYDSANYGVPQRRERIIILGNRDGYKIPLIPPTHSESGKNGLAKWQTFRDAIKGLTKCTSASIPSKRLKYFQMLGPGEYWRNLPASLQKEAMGKSFDLPGGKTGFYRRLSWDEPSPTLVTCPTMPATDLIHPVEDRPLSIEEYARIQMFPDDWEFKGTLAEIYKQIGNAVPVGMGYAAARHLLWFDSLSDSEKELVQLIDPSAVYSRYKNTSFVYFEQLRTKFKNFLSNKGA